MTERYRGSCLCKTIRFEIDEFQPRAGHCHCSMCRKFHGAAYATIAEVKENHFRWVSGANSLKSFTAENATMRSFCNTCGSSLTFFSPNTAPGSIEIALACLDDDVPVEPDAHIYVASGANWDTIHDDLPRFEAGRDSTRIK